MKTNLPLAAAVLLSIATTATAQFQTVDPCCDSLTATEVVEPYYVTPATVDLCSSPAMIPCPDTVTPYEPTVLPYASPQPLATGYQVAAPALPVSQPYAPAQAPYYAPPTVGPPPVLASAGASPRIPQSYYVGQSLFRQPTLYGQGQPIRNFFRFLVP